MEHLTISDTTSQKDSYWLGSVFWVVGWIAIYFFDDYLDSSNLAMLLILTSALAAVCLPWRLSVSLAIIFVLIFDWFFVPPRGTFTVDFHQHTVMLLVMLVVNIIIVSLMAIRRSQSELAQRHAHEADILRQWSDVLLESKSPQDHFDELQHLLTKISGKKVSLFLLKDMLPPKDDIQCVVQLGNAGIEQTHALWYCTRNNQQLGRGTGRYEMFSDVYLPLRARNQALGAALLAQFSEHEFSTRVHLQAICDQFGHALEKYRLQQLEIKARENSQAQLIRNNLLAAISHDYRTPLATIMSAASSLNEQAEKLDAAQQYQLAQRIFNEAERLNKVTLNILQLARLDADNRINCDWESAEEIIGNLIRPWRERNFGDRLHANLKENLPLIWCDSVLIGQLLENLADNAFKYSPSNSIVKLSVDANTTHFLFSVTDTGPGIDPPLHSKIFEPFQRGKIAQTQTFGAGVGLALCRAIAIAHQGDLILECPLEGGSRFTLSIPLRNLPMDVRDSSSGEICE
ncbi:MAG: DUF4118 domain-containing protein [Gammaproteobacteria bacterium]|nr:MAG: DUF4118 domain-containing protein [Gammaproteobacteria bacterium]